MTRFASLLGRGHPPLTALCVVVLSLLLAPATSAQTILDLTTDGATATHNGAIFEQGDGGVSAGSGIFDPFYQIQSANLNAVSGVNTAGRPTQFQTVANGVGAATELLLSTVTQIEVGGILYREFFLDINQTSGGAIYDMLDVQMYTDDQPDLNCLDPATRTWGLCDPDGQADLIFWLDGAPGGNASVRLNYNLEPGSGRRDLRMMIPDADFNAGPECDYGQVGCGLYVYLYSSFFENDDGFEEWSTAVQPFIQISKTANGSLEEDTQWDITKTVSPDAWTFFSGDTGTSKYTLTLDKTVTQGEIQVTGSITMSVPELLPDGDENAVAADVTALTDIFEGVAATSISCSSGPPPFTIDPGETVTCEYEIDLDSEVTGTNTATATILNRDGSPQNYVATAEVGSFVAVASPGSEPGTINVTDSNGQTFGPFSDDATPMYEVTFSCDDEGTNPNTATIDETGDSDGASVTVTCYDLAVAKTVDTFKTINYDWDVEKSVTPDTWALFNGQSGTSGYTVSVTRTSMESGFMASGSITITNPAPMVATLTGVADLITPGDVVATVDCGGATEIAANGGELVCTYSVDLTNEQAAAATTNTATATVQNVAYPVVGPPAPSGTTDFSVQEAVVFDDDTIVTEIDETATVTDDWATPGDTGDDQSWSFGGDGQQTYDITFDCSADEGQRVNTVRIVGDDTDTEYGTDDATVTVMCYELVVSKTAETSYDRDYDWTIDKVGPTLTDPLQQGQVYIAQYSVSLTPTATDFNFAVSGTITVTNEHPTLAASITLVDALPGAVLACGGVLDVPADDSATCDYTAPLADASDGVNTATATFAGIDYVGSQDFAFGDPTNTTDECAAVSDLFDGEAPVELGQVCVDGTLSFEYQRQLDTQECGPYTLNNTASFLTNDNGDTGSDSHTVEWEVVGCEVVGCTLTRGYWQTHNFSFKEGEGGPPIDEAWNLIVPSAEQSPFFNSGTSYYGAMWTPPRGNAYYQLAPQWIAAKLNSLNDEGPMSMPDEVQEAFDDAEDWMSTNPSDATARNERRRVRGWASILGSFNEGDYPGYPHCDEQDASSNGDADRTVDGSPDGSRDAELAEAGVDDEATDGLSARRSGPEAAAPTLAAVAAEAVEFGLDAPAPNPARGAVTLRFHLPEATRVTLEVFDVLGRRVESLVGGDTRASGSHAVTLATGPMPAGVYVIVIETATHRAIERLTVIR